MTANGRKAGLAIDDLFLRRWSPRAMSGDSLDESEFMPLFEAARWAPSSFNNQPWRFVYAKRGTKQWDVLFSLMTDSNKAWAKNASVLVVIISKKTFDYNGKPSITHTFDTGAAWENLALQGTICNLAVHGMEGFSFERAKNELNVPDDFQVEAMAAIGRRGNKDELSPALKEIEFPSDRKQLKDIVFEGKMG